MKPTYMQTPNPPEECRGRLEERVGKARWRRGISLFSIGVARHCDKPLVGTVGPSGFDVAEAGPDGYGIELPHIRGRWVALGERTVIRLRPYLKWHWWCGQIIGGVFCGCVLTFLAIAVAGSMSDWTAGAVLLCFSALCAAVLLKINHLQMSSRGRELVRRFSVLFEAERIEEMEGYELEMHFGL